MVTPLVCMKFSDTRYFPKHWENAHEFFRHCETKNFRRKTVTPILCKNNFDTRVFLKLWSDVNEIFGTLRQKISDVKTWYLLLCTKLFEYPKFSETMKGCPRFFGTLRREIFDRKTWCPLLCKKISDTTFFLTHCRDALEDIRYWETKFFDRNMWYAPFFIRKQFSESKTFSKTVGLLHKNFRHCETDNFRRKILTPLLCIIFSIPEFFWNIEGMPTKIFGTLRQSIFDGKTRYPLS